MPIGPGANDAQGIWQYGEDDIGPGGLWSNYMNKGQASISTQLAADRAKDADRANTFVATTDAARNTYFGSPASAAARRALQDDGAICVRPDKGWTEQYFAGMTDGGANPGGVLTPGWYPILGNMPMIRARRGAAQTFAGSWTLANAVFSTPFQKDFTYSAGAFTCTVAGWYDLSAFYKASVVSTTALGLQIVLNSTSVDTTASLVRMTMPVSAFEVQVAVQARLAVGDVLRLYVFASASGNPALAEDFKLDVEYRRPPWGA